MSTMEEKLHQWVVQELNVLSDGRLKTFPPSSSFRCLTQGKKNKRIWEYVVNHVRSRPDAQKIKNILMLKRRQDEEIGVYRQPITDTAIEKTRQLITRAHEKRAFLEKSLSVIKDEVVISENDVRKHKEEVSIINQKSAILQLVALQHKEKIMFLNSVNNQLLSHVSDRNSKDKTPFYLNIYNLSAVGIPQSSQSVFGDGNIAEIKFRLREITMVVTEKLRKKDIDLMADRMKLNCGDMSKVVSLPDLLIHLKDLAKASHMDLMSVEASVSCKVLDDMESGESKRLLRQMKLNHTESAFSAQKLKNKNFDLSQKKDSILVKISEKMADGIGEKKKIELLCKMAKNEGLRASIDFLEQTLKREKQRTKKLIDCNRQHTASRNNLETALNGFYSDFDIVNVLQASSPNMLEITLKIFSELYTFVNGHLFVNVNLAFQEFPFKVKSDLDLEMEGMWNLFKKNGLIKALSEDPLLSAGTVPSELDEMVGKQPFQNLKLVARNITQIKRQLFLNSRMKFCYEGDEASDLPQKYFKMVDMLQEMQEHLQSCSKNVSQTMPCVERVEVVLDDWWHQQAQYIPEIEYGDKTLKMWQDILIHMDGQ